MSQDLLSYVWQGLLTLILGITGWFVRDTMDQNRRIREDHEAHKLEVARDYATKSELLRTEDGIKAVLDRLDAKMDRILEGRR